MAKKIERGGRPLRRPAERTTFASAIVAAIFSALQLDGPGVELSTVLTGIVGVVPSIVSKFVDSLDDRKEERQSRTQLLERGVTALERAVGIEPPPEDEPAEDSPIEAARLERVLRRALESTLASLPKDPSKSQREAERKGDEAASRKPTRGRAEEAEKKRQQERTD